MTHTQNTFPNPDFGSGFAIRIGISLLSFVSGELQKRAIDAVSTKTQWDYGDLEISLVVATVSKLIYYIVEHDILDLRRDFSKIALHH